MRPQEVERLFFGLLDADPAGSYSLDQPGLPVLARIPFVHTDEDAVGLANGDDRTGSDFLQVSVRHDGRNLDNPVRRRIQAGHLEVDPDQVGCGIGYCGCRRAHQSCSG
jgi:hypothetical protein